MVSTLPVDDLLRNLSIKDLRMQCRARGINPAGNADSLRERIQEDMTRGSDYTLHQAAPDGGFMPAPGQGAPAGYVPSEDSRPATGRSAHGTGGGTSQIHFGDYKTDYSTQQYGTRVEPPTAAETMHPNPGAAAEDFRHAPPPATPDAGRPKFAGSGGGHSQLSFGDYQLPSSQQGNRPPGLVPVVERDPKQEEVSISVRDTVKPLLLKDLRIQLRARGLSPAGSVEELRQRLAEDMMRTGNLSLAMDVNLVNPYAQGVMPPPPSYQPSMASSGRTPAGGQSQISFGDYTLPSHVQPKPAEGAPHHGHVAPAPWEQGGHDQFRPSSRQIEPPGGRGNQIHFG
ncbi:hypothetical protein DUNSADRAFT_12067 [Dunaliella salina]|uniref:SAP domain-containing protein n=1 Tax=Dunaliella salina TaxID=3046 RepID=A0ABQ7H428_DUNSA|nr:hypothetical protein DUNSADRAFT_12067 [Dunaliella salina]|eukprot:KAF5841611.1 hypothetical protein DUNSADRAFT_12067 [Dunaliella salina]